ncbi:MAG: hypothetical protein CL596_05335 [Alteromonas sp.]|nr:hypothetical protein [Alteromonas sp.]|tara:strand:+ start:235 stop:1734 length:1500 start_codon:yes stop_codon:yes gene_type:complete
MKIDKQNLTGEITLNAGHSIIVGHKPIDVPTESFKERIENKPNIDILSFGLFETASPNYTTYYPEVTADDLDPKEEEFIYPIFRMLSETIVSKGAPIDFSKKNVLKKSMGMLLGQTINIDHEFAVGNAIGAVKEVFWQKSYKDGDIVVPAGINAVMMIDGKSNPRIARGINMNPPSIHSNSVTVRFKWEPSHEFEDQNEFYWKVGTYDEDGKLIRLIVTEITSYHETSLVSHGADAFAQKIGEDGKIVNPKYASKVYSFAVDKPITGIFQLDYKSQNLNFMADSIPDSINNNHNKNNNLENMDKILDELNSQFGFEGDKKLTKENLVSSLKTNFDTVQGQKDKLETEVQTLKDEKADLQNSLDDSEKEVEKLKGYKDQSDKIDKLTSDVRAEALKHYKLAKGKDADEGIINLINTANLETAKSLLNDYSKESDSKFAATCNKCGSDDVSRASAKTTSNTGGDEGDDTPVSGGKDSEVKKSLTMKKRRKSRFYLGESDNN